MFLLLIFISSLLFSIDFESITEEDWKENVFENYKDCHAIILFKKYILDGEGLKSTREVVYKRIKILDDEGLKYAKLNYEYSLDYIKFFNVKARTIYPDGFIYNLEEKDIYINDKEQNIRIISFEVPNAKPGCIIEYIFEKNISPIISYYISFQEDIPIKKFIFQWYIGPYIIPGFYFPKIKEKNTEVLYIPNRKKPNKIIITIKNIEPYKPEEYSPPLSETSMVAYFYYNNENPKDFWDEFSRKVNSDIKIFKKKMKRIKEIFKDIPDGVSNEEKLKYAYYFLQEKIKNSAYLKKELREEIKNFDEMIRKGYASSYSINLAFISIAQELGFKAYLVGVCDKKNFYFKKEIPTTVQIKKFLVSILNSNGSLNFFEPDNKFMPFRVIKYNYQATTAIMFKEKGFELISIPEGNKDENISHYNLELYLNSDLSANCRMKIKLKGQPSYEFQEIYFEKNELEKKEMIEKKIEEFFAEKVFINFYEIKMPKKNEEDLELSYQFKIQNLIKEDGYLNPAILHLKENQPFKEEKRINNIVFDYNETIIDEVFIILPQNLEIISIPNNINWENFFGSYEAKFSIERNIIKYKRILKRNKQVLPAIHYNYVKDFYQKMKEFDQSLIHLKQK